MSEVSADRSSPPQQSWWEDRGAALAVSATLIGVLMVGSATSNPEVDSDNHAEEPRGAARVAPSLQSPNDITIDTRLTIKRAAKVFGCELQKDMSPATPADSDRWAKPAEKQCAQHVAKIIGRNSFGWDNKQHGALKQLWQHESGWSANADNPVSTAFGIPQSLQSLHNPELYREYGKGKFSYDKNPLTQIQWGLRYIHRAYGTPAKAWQTWQSRSPHWY